MAKLHKTIIFYIHGVISTQIVQILVSPVVQSSDCIQPNIYVQVTKWRNSIFLVTKQNLLCDKDVVCAHIPYYSLMPDWGRQAHKQPGMQLRLHTQVCSLCTVLAI